MARTLVAARELTRLLAVVGRPQNANQLDVVARAFGVASDPVPFLREAVDAGVLDVGTDRRYWFTHPLLAEVLEEGLLPEERRPGTPRLQQRWNWPPPRK